MHFFSNLFMTHSRVWQRVTGLKVTTATRGQTTLPDCWKPSDILVGCSLCCLLIWEFFAYVLWIIVYKKRLNVVSWFFIKSVEFFLNDFCRNMILKTRVGFKISLLPYHVFYLLRMYHCVSICIYHCAFICIYHCVSICM